MKRPAISISIVSHGQGGLVRALLNDLERHCRNESIEVLLTINVPESFSGNLHDTAFPIVVISNSQPKGFGENHNAAFKIARGEWFCVMNPDIRMSTNPFQILLDEIVRNQAAVIAPAVLSPTGRIEDSVRRFPRPLNLASKLLGRGDGRYSFAVGDKAFAADWVGGMFMLFRADSYRSVGGFDERFFLYYEDVDICTRLWKEGCLVLACPTAQVVHDARRTSRRSLKYLRWHVASMARYLAKHWLRLPNTLKQPSIHM